MKLLFPFSGVAGIFFPVGKPPWGTCEFATKRCLVECAAFKNAKKAMGKDKPGNIIGYKPKQRAFEFITNRSLPIIHRKILSELERLKTKILYWFASGDCQTYQSQRISEVMKLLSSADVIQCGFTRNKKLWEKTQDIPNVRFVLTVEGWNEAYKIREKTNIKGLYALPNFESCAVTIFCYKWYAKEPKWEYSCPPPHSNRIGIKNPPITGYKVEELDKETNCQECYDAQKGCFTNYSR